MNIINDKDFNYPNNIDLDTNINLDKKLLFNYYSVCQSIDQLNYRYKTNQQKIIELEYKIITIIKHLYFILLFLSFYTFLILCTFCYLI